MIWNYTRGGSKLEYTLGQHTKSVTCVKWGGEGLLYTASQVRCTKDCSAHMAMQMYYTILYLVLEDV